MRMTGCGSRTLVWLSGAGGFPMEVGRCAVGGAVYSCPRESRLQKTPWKEQLGTGQLGRGRRMGGWEGQASSKALEVPMRLGTPPAPAP